MKLTKRADHEYTDAETGNSFFVSGSGSSWSAKMNSVLNTNIPISATFATQGEAETALGEFVGTVGFIDLT